MQIKDIALSRNQLIVLTSKGCLLGATNEQVKQHKLVKVSSCENFVAIASSNSHSLALSKEYEEPFEQKTPEQVAQFLFDEFGSNNHKGFTMDEETSKKALDLEIDGKKLIEIDK